MRLRLSWAVARGIGRAVKPLDEKTSLTMARVRSSGTQPEARTASALRALGLAYRKQVRALPGTPDFANRRQGWAVLVHGCFWHRHGCARTTTPVHNAEAWAAKFARNQARDLRTTAALEGLGLRVAVVWECETRDVAVLAERLGAALDVSGAQRRRASQTLASPQARSPTTRRVRSKPAASSARS